MRSDSSASGERTAAPRPAPPRGERAWSARVLWAGGLGNVLEWYDFGLYGLLAPVLASLFFPNQNRLIALLDVYGGFAAGFAMRPIGAAVLGRVGDRIGRRSVLVLSVVLMGAATVALGALPSYASWGLWAPVLLVAIRLLQGFSVGGEFVGSVTYLVEQAPPGRRGLAGSTANFGATAGLLLAAGAAAGAASWAGAARLAAGVWRWPFLFGGVIALAAYLLRRHLPEREVAPAAPRRRSPLGQALREAPRLMLLVTLFTSGYGIADYLTMVFLPTFAHEFGRVSIAAALRANTAGQALALFVVPVAGWLSDRVARRRTILAVAFFAEAAIAWSAFAWARQGAGEFYLAQLAFAGLLALIMGAGPAMLAEQFPPDYRVTGHAVAFNIGIGIAGGSAPLVAVALIRAAAAPMAAAAYLAGAALLAAITALLLRDRSREPAI